MTKFRTEPYWEKKVRRNDSDLSEPERSVWWSSDSPLYHKGKEDVRNVVKMRDAIVDHMGPLFTDQDDDDDDEEDEYFQRVTRTWRLHVLRRITTWHYYWTTWLMTYFYRRFMPMEPYQWEAEGDADTYGSDCPGTHLQLNYVVTVVMEWISANEVEIDDILDNTDGRVSEENDIGGKKADSWHLVHRHSYAADLMTLAHYAVRLIEVSHSLIDCLD